MYMAIQSLYQRCNGSNPSEGSSVCIYSTAQRQHYSCSWSIEYVVFRLIKQLVVACAKLSTSVLYV